MTIQEALDQVDILKPNSVPTDAKIGWLSNLDLTIMREVIMTHEPPAHIPQHEEDTEVREFRGYDSDTDRGTELLVKAPYDQDLYGFYLAARVDLVNMENDKYNNDMELYNAALTAFQNAYNRAYMPIQRVRKLKY